MFYWGALQRIGFASALLGLLWMLTLWAMNGVHP